MYQNITIRSIYAVSGGLSLLGYCANIATINVIRPFNYYSLHSLSGIIGLLVSWLPVVVLIPICLVYGITECQPKYGSVRKLCYSNLLLYMITLIPLFSPDFLVCLISNKVLTAIVLFTAVAGTVLHFQAAALLDQDGFCIRHEIQAIKIIYGKITPQRKCRYLQYLFCSIVVLHTIPHSRMSYIFTSMSLAVLLLLPLQKLVRSYSDMEPVLKINLKWLYVNHMTAFIASIVLFILLYPYHFPALLTSCLAGYMGCVVGGRHCRHIYSLCGFDE
jgi:hypothetical protein